MNKQRNQLLDHLSLYTSYPNVYFGLSKLTILKTFVETESNHSGHKTVTSSGNFQSRGRNRVQNRIISATFADLQCMQPLSSQKNPSHVWCSPLVANRKLNQRRLNTKYTPRPLVLSGPLLLFNAIFWPPLHIYMLRVSNALLSNSCSLLTATLFVALKIAQN
jgi:hypothetical protein